MRDEADDLSKFVRRWVSLDGATGKLRPGRFRIDGGKQSRGAREIADDVTWTEDLDEVLEQLIDRIESARADGSAKRIYVRAMIEGRTHPSATLALPGNPTAGEADPEETSLAGAHAIVVQRLQASNDNLVMMLGSVMHEQSELRVRAAIALTENEMLEKYGTANSMGKMIESMNLGPTLQTAIPQAMQIYAMHAFAGSAPDADPSPAGQARARAHGVETAAAGLFAQLSAMHGAGALTPEILAEISARLQGLIGRAMAAMAALNQPPKPADNPAPAADNPNPITKTEAA